MWDTLYNIHIWYIYAWPIVEFEMEKYLGFLIFILCLLKLKKVTSLTHVPIFFLVICLFSTIYIDEKSGRRASHSGQRASNRQRPEISDQSNQISGRCDVLFGRCEIFCDHWGSRAFSIYDLYDWFKKKIITITCIKYYYFILFSRFWLPW